MTDLIQISKKIKGMKKLSKNEFFCFIDNYLQNCSSYKEVIKINPLVKLSRSIYPDYFVDLIIDKIDLELMFYSRVIDYNTRFYKTYIIKNCITNHYKIGKTSQDKVKKRIDQISIGAKKELICYFNIDIENILHKKYKNKKVYGEWFNLNINDINTIKSKYLKHLKDFK